MVTDLNEAKSRPKTEELKREQLIHQLFALKNELLESRKEYSDLYNYNSSIYFTIDKKYIIQTVNFQAAHLLGMNRKQLHHKLFLNFITSHSHQIFKSSIETLCDKQCKQSCDIELIAKGGAKKSVTLESMLIKDGLIRLCLSDNTNSRACTQQRLQLEQSLNVTNHLLQLSSDAAAAVDRELYVILLNQSFCDFFSMAFATKIEVGMSLIMALSDFPDLKAKLINACQEALLGNKTYVMIENHRTKNEIDYCYEISINSLFNHYYQKNELIIRIKNLTEYKLQERQHLKQHADIAQSSRTSALVEIASALTHEINQPLASISAYSRACLFLLNNQLAHNTARNELLIPLEQIAFQAEHAGKIIHNVTNFMRNVSISKEETDFNLLIKETLTILDYELLDFKLKITLNLMDDLPLIMTNKTQMMQVISNLARNSIEALRPAFKDNPELRIETCISNNHINVHVRDNGPGIPKELKNKVLNTYFTTKPQGTGLGLGICRTLIEEHGGKLIIKEHDEPGAWFLFSLPITPINHNPHV